MKLPFHHLTGLQWSAISHERTYSMSTLLMYMRSHHQYLGGMRVMYPQGTGLEHLVEKGGKACT